MNKALILGARMRTKANKIVELEEAITELNNRSAIEAEKLDRAETEEEVSTVEKSLEEIQKELEEKQAEKEKLEEEIEELQKQVDEQNRKAPTFKDVEQRGGKKLEQRDAIAKFIRTGQTRDIEGLKTTDSGSAALIPTEVLKPHFLEKTRNPLLDLVQRVQVNSGSGKYPVIKKTDGKMASTDELKANPELGKPKISEIDYSIKTYRGYIPVSQEMIDDADYDIMSIVEDEVVNQGENTELSLITAVLKTATPADAAGFDAVVLGTGTVDLYNDKVLRSMQGSHFHIPVFQADLKDYLPMLKDKGVQVAVTALHRDSKDYTILQGSTDVAIVVGNEGQGVSDAVIDLADVVVTIPMFGKAESLNVAIASALLMYKTKEKKE